MASTETQTALQSASPDGTGQLIRFESHCLFFRLIVSIGVIQLDPWLEPFRDALKQRFQYVESWVKTINETEGGLDKFSRVRDIYCCYCCSR